MRLDRSVRDAANPVRAHRMVYRTKLLTNASVHITIRPRLAADEPGEAVRSLMYRSNRGRMENLDRIQLELHRSASKP